MSDIKIKADELEEFADQIGKAERECNDALDAINWHFSSLLANFPGVVPGSIHNLEADLKYSIKKYKSKLDDAQRIVKLTAANMKNDEQKMSGKVGEFLLELVGWYDIQRVFSEYDPVTGEKLSAGDRVLAVGFLALTFVPPAKAAGVGGKAVIKGVDAGLPSLAKSPEVFMKIRNVLDPKRVQQAFRSVYNEVVKGPIAATKAWFDKIKKGIGDIPIPQLRQEAVAGVGVVNKTVRDAFGDAKDFIQRINSSKVDKVDVKGTGEVSKKISDSPHVKEAKDLIAERTEGLDLKEHPTTTKQMSSNKMKELKDKIDNRTITKQEYADYIWNKKFAKRRDKGVKEYWYQEQQRLLNNESLTRNWSQEQIKDILSGKTPKYDGKPIAGHHSYSASKYPHLADRGEIIYPVTFNEHLKGWHGGNWRNSIPGEPIIPIKDF
ncbi:pre-toxin TG domain-containing protein [Bacillus sinesaloumensis]|uniref:pre-toxin TG domain-containing protein n=1 Tax=Litchfieldia sinesaloumensis TaxID=1926280 RepID=UPI0009882F13|nr:pre-toxin TG domain-containing protein [Bacillus sinesaloumensis]